jgi:hypothetical protein
MIISLFMEPTPLSGGGGTGQAAGPDDQQHGREPRDLRSNERQKHMDHVSATASPRVSAALKLNPGETAPLKGGAASPELNW